MKRIILTLGKTLYCSVMFLAGTLLVRPRSAQAIIQELKGFIFSLQKYIELLIEIIKIKF